MSEVAVERVREFGGPRVTAPPSRPVCQCCPYGYHIDLGFVEFCDRLVKENSQPNPEKKERRERRRQRQSMEVLLGLTNPVFWNFQQLLPTVESHVSELLDNPPPPPPRRSSLASDNDGLKKAVQDFEATLERTRQKIISGNARRRNEEVKLVIEANKEEIVTLPPPTAPLKSIREQMAMSLEKMRDLEEKVKTIPALERQIDDLEDQKTNLEAQINELKEQINEEKDKFQIFSLTRPTKPNKNPTRDIAINCSTITRDIGISPVVPKLKSTASSTNLLLMADVGCGTDHIEEAPPQPRISLKDLDVFGEWSVPKSSQGNLPQPLVPQRVIDSATQTDSTPLMKTVPQVNLIQPLKPRKVFDASTQTDAPPVLKTVGTVIKPIMVDAVVQVKPICRDRGVSDDKTTVTICDKCSSIETKNIGVGHGNVKEVSSVLLGIANRSKSFDLTSRKNTRSIGVSTIPVVKKLTATKQVGTVDVSIPKRNTGVNTDIKSYKDAAVIVDFVLKEPRPEVKESQQKEPSSEVKGFAEGPKEVAKEVATKDPKETGVIKKSKIPLAKPTTPQPERKKLMRQDTYMKQMPLTLSVPAEVMNRLTSSSKLPQATEEEKVEVTLRKKTPKPTEDVVAETAHRLSRDLHLDGASVDRLSGVFDDCGFEYDEFYAEQESNRNSQMFPDSAMFQPIQDKSREKLVPSKEMKAAMKVVNDALHKYPNGLPKHLKTASSIIQQEWFKISSTASANPLDVEDYLDSFEEVSNTLLEFVVNMVDNNGNTAMHYAVSHGNFDVVSILLDSKVCNINKANAAGYTCVMLVSLAQVRSETHREVVRRLFLLADVNVRAKQHGQTALMLAVSHGRLDMVQLLLDAGADPNIQDCDGSTALMCAAEHGHLEIVKHILAHPDTDPSIVDCDGSSALAIAMEANNRDIGVLLYAREHFAPNSRGSSPYTSFRQRRNRHPSSPHPKTPTSPGPHKRSDH